MLFRGTDRYASAEIDQLFDGMGAELNAGTDKEGTTVYARMLDQHLPRAFDVMADMVWRPAFNDVDPEREVVLEEIAMYEDDPQDTVFDVVERRAPHHVGDHVERAREVLVEHPRVDRRALLVGPRVELGAHPVEQLVDLGEPNRSVPRNSMCSRKCESPPPRCARRASPRPRRSRGPRIARRSLLRDDPQPRVQRCEPVLGQG